jgi:hypothetical protein
MSAGHGSTAATVQSSNMASLHPLLMKYDEATQCTCGITQQCSATAEGTQTHSSSTRMHSLLMTFDVAIQCTCSISQQCAAVTEISIQ